MGVINNTGYEKYKKIALEMERLSKLGGEQIPCDDEDITAKYIYHGFVVSIGEDKKNGINKGISIKDSEENIELLYLDTSDKPFCAFYLNKAAKLKIPYFYVSYQIKPSDCLLWTDKQFINMLTMRAAGNVPGSMVPNSITTIVEKELELIRGDEDSNPQYKAALNSGLTFLTDLEKLVQDKNQSNEIGSNTIISKISSLTRKIFPKDIAAARHVINKDLEEEKIDPPIGPEQN